VKPAITASAFNQLVQHVSRRTKIHSKVMTVSCKFWTVFCLTQCVTTVSYHVCYRVDQCDVKSSKKRPLFLVWTNPDPMAQCLSSDFQIIFKTGDGWYIALPMFIFPFQFRFSCSFCFINNTNQINSVWCDKLSTSSFLHNETCVSWLLVC